jgi:hypothetical protein
MDDVERKLARIEVETDRREEAWSRIRAAVERGVLGETYAGLWIAKDGQCLVVAVTNRPEPAATTLRDIAPEAPLRVVWRRHPLAMLEALADELIEMGDRLGAPWAYVGVCQPSNVVQAALTNLDHPASRALQKHFRRSCRFGGEVHRGRSMTMPLQQR